MRSLEFAIRESITGIIRNGLMSMASITTVALSLAVVGSFVLLALGLNNVVQSQLSKFEIAVWMDGKVSEMQIADVDTQLRSLPHVKSVEHRTPEYTWEKIQKDWKDKVNLNGVKPDSITHHFLVRLDDQRYTQTTTEKIRKFGHVEEVIAAQKVVEHMVRFSDLVELIGWASAGVLFLVAAFIVSNTIRLTLYARRREIKIMQLVGATNWFIRMPFFFEGMVLGAVGGAVAGAMIFGGAHYLDEMVTKIMPMLSQFSSGLDPMRFYGTLVAAGCFVGAAGSLMSIRRFLKL